MKVLTRAQVLAMHQALLNTYGGSAGIRDEGLLDSALAAPFQTFDGNAMLPSIQQKAARLCYGLVMNHPFVDGNKRTGTHIMLTFLAMNGIELQYTQKELYETILSMAAGKLSCDTMLQWIINHEV